MSRRYIHVGWATRWFSFHADRLGFTFAYGRPLHVPEVDEILYHPHVVGVRKGIGGWRVINR